MPTNDFLRQVQRGIDYIEAHLDEDIELCRVSRAAGISHWHFQRIFKAMTSETLKVYIRSRRMARSLDALLTTDARILDIALRAGFESQESFTRAFKRQFDLTPRQYRKLGDKSRFLEKVRFDAEYLQHINGNVSLTPEVRPQPTLNLVGMRTHFFSVDSEKNNIGEQLPPLWEQFLARLGEVERAVPGVCYGVVRQSEVDGDRLEYHAAAEVPVDADPPPGMVRVQVPAATYARFEHRGPARDIDRTVNYIYSTWLANSGHRHSYGADLEIYGEGYHPTSSDSTMSYAIPLA